MSNGSYVNCISFRYLYFSVWILGEILHFSIFVYRFNQIHFAILKMNKQLPQYLPAEWNSSTMLCTEFHVVAIVTVTVRIRSSWWIWLYSNSTTLRSSFGDFEHECFQRHTSSGRSLLFSINGRMHIAHEIDPNRDHFDKNFQFIAFQLRGKIHWIHWIGRVGSNNCRLYFEW